MSYRLGYDLIDPVTGSKHPLVLSGGMWNGDTLLYEFMLQDHGLSGRIECDWRSSGPNYTLDQGAVTTEAQRRALELVTQVLAPFFSKAFAGITDEQLAQLYPGDYHKGSGYCDEQSAIEKELKGAIADMVVRTLKCRKLLDAGCAGGLLVREFRERGVDAHGFDHCPDLAEIAVPDAAPFVRQGSVSNIPYGPEDGFDTLVCIDVFEHVPEDRVPQMVAEFDRLGVRNLAVHISHTELEHFGHITLRPLSWWDDQLGAKFRRVQSPAAELLAIPRPFDPKRVLRIYQKVEAPIELTPARPPSAASRSGGAAPAASTPR
ncbi:MAG: class I SAM-dependent methyltransferase [Planctomycetes bacterium]|nr:class I SAM-dependent methyltransferase [Planctomycetota bacterium]